MLSRNCPDLLRSYRRWNNRNLAVCPSSEASLLSPCVRLFSLFFMPRCKFRAYKKLGQEPLIFPKIYLFPDISRTGIDLSHPQLEPPLEPCQQTIPHCET